MKLVNLGLLGLAIGCSAFGAASADGAVQPAAAPAWVVWAVSQGVAIAILAWLGLKAYPEWLKHDERIRSADREMFRGQLLQLAERISTGQRAIHDRVDALTTMLAQAMARLGRE